MGRGAIKNGVTSERASVVSVPPLFFTSLTRLDPGAEPGEIGSLVRVIDGGATTGEALIT